MEAADLSAVVRCVPGRVSGIFRNYKNFVAVHGVGSVGRIATINIIVRSHFKPGTSVKVCRCKVC